VLGGAPGDAFATLERWSRSHGLPGLDALGISAADRRAAAAAAATSSSMQSNPAALDAQALETLMEHAR
ncbi:MAG: alcohol dehydrogenase, partial [Rhodobacter sp.]|nr:alcohol dehydrogenase [Rhodobacter sp.]